MTRRRHGLPLWALCATLAWPIAPAAQRTSPPPATDRTQRGQETPDAMRQRRTDHFNVSFRGPSQSSLSYGVLEVLETAYWRIGGTLSVRPNVPIPVVLYTTEQFHDITRSPSWAVGAFDGTIRIPMRGALDDRRELERVLSHEYTHALIHQLSPRPVPIWLNEGLAAALEADNVEWARDRVRRAGKAIPLAVLNRPFRLLTADQAALAYASSALAAERLLEEAGGGAIVHLLRDVGQGRDFDVAFADRTRRTLADFQSELNGVP